MVSAYGIPSRRFKNIPLPTLTCNNLIPIFVLKQYFSYIFVFSKLNLLDDFSDDELIAKYRLSREGILDLLETIAPDLQKTTH